LGGDWDLSTAELKARDVFPSIEQRFLEGRPWSETSHYRYLMSLVGQQRRARSFSSEADVLKWFDSIDRLYQRIRDQGYIMQRALGTYAPWDEINVAVSRDGELLFVDGAHRLAIAKVLRLKAVPVQVTIVHQEWHDRQGRQWSTTLGSKGGSIWWWDGQPKWLDRKLEVHGSIRNRPRSRPAKRTPRTGASDNLDPGQ
jgi:hypothetical protein